MMKIRTKLSKELQKESLAALNKLSIWALINAAWMIGFFINRIVIDKVRIYDDILLAIGLLFILLAIIFLLYIRKSSKKAEKLNLYSDTTFNEDHFYVELYDKNELIATEKVYYCNCTSYYESPHYIFIMTYRGASHGISKEEGLISFLSDKVKRTKK